MGKTEKERRVRTMVVTERLVPRVEIDELSIPEAEIIRPKAGRFWGALRLLMGFTFLWAFLDKMFALGFATGRNPTTGGIDFFGPAAWIRGGSPTDGFLGFGLHTKEPFYSFYHGMVGSTFVEWAFMLSLLGIGIALMFGIVTRIAAIGGAVLLVMMYLAGSLFPANNPLIDEHIIEAVVLVGIAYVGAGRYLGLGNKWRKTRLVKKYPILE
jgi:thiosulfate dehydrogenase [quinone] large subunit